MQEQHRHVYVASCDPQGGIAHYHMTSSGTLSIVDMTPMENPKYMVIANGKMYIVLGGLEESHLAVYALDENGMLGERLSYDSTQGTEACHLLVNGNTVYCANYFSGSIIKMPDRLIRHIGKGVHPTRQDMAHAHYVGLTPDGKYVLAVDLGVDTIFQYDLDLCLVAKTKLPDGHGPRHLVFSDDGKTCFVVNELISSVTVCSYENERLTVQDTVSTLPDGYTDVSYGSAIRCRGDKIYASNRGHNSIAVMGFADKKLTLESLFDCGGDFPRDFDLIDDILVCTNQKSDDVCVFRQTKDDGYVLTDKVSLKTPICVVFA